MADLSHYRQYIKERSNQELVEHPHGFATYQQIDADTVYLVDIFVEPEHRRAGIASELSEKIAEISRRLGAKKLIGSVDLNAKGVTQSLKAILADGFEYSHAQGAGLYFVKGL